MNDINLSQTEVSGIYSTLSVNSNSQIIITIVLLLFWSALYALVNYTCQLKSLSQKDANDTKNRIVSIVHGVVSFWCATAEYLPYPVFKYFSILNHS